MALRTGTDGFLVHGREIYWWHRKKQAHRCFRPCRSGQSVYDTMSGYGCDKDHVSDSPST